MGITGAFFTALANCVGPQTPNPSCFKKEATSSHPYFTWRLPFTKVASPGDKGVPSTRRGRLRW